MRPIIVALIGAVASILAAYLTARPIAASTAKETVIGLKGVPIGTIVASTLRPTDFTNEMGDSWVPADGRNVLPEWAYSKLTGETKVPDLRGVFLRGLNVFDSSRPNRIDGYIDPMKDADERQAGAPQMDTVGPHIHQILKAASDVTEAKMTSGSRRFPSDLIDSFAHGPAFNTEQNPGAETQPKNVAVYWYMRVD